jgi:putative membrane protein
MRELPWESITAIDANQPLALRLLGIYQVTLVQAGEDVTQIRIRGIGRDMLSAIEDRWERHRDKDGRRAVVALAPDEGVCVKEPGQGVPVPPDFEVSLYRSKVVDLAIASLAYGRFIVLAPAIAFSLWDLAESAGVGNIVMDYVSTASPPVVGAVALVVALLGSVVATIVRFHGFCVSADACDGLVLRYGLMERRRRRIDTSAVVAITLQRNIFEQASGRARLSLLTRDSAGQLGSNLLLPSLPISVIEPILRDRFIGEGKSCMLGRKAPVLSCLLCAGVLVVLPVATCLLVTAYTSLVLGWAVLFAVVCFGITYRLGILLTSTLSLDDEGDGVVLHTKFIYERQILMVGTGANAELHAITGLYAGSSPGRRPLLVSVSFYAGGPKQYRAAHCSQKHISAIAARMSFGGAIGDTMCVTLDRRA